jgi:hypothetical protein
LSKTGRRFGAQVRAEKPAWYQAVIGGALLRTLDFVAARSAEYLGYLEKGQLPPARLTLTAFEEAFVLDGAPCYTACEPHQPLPLPTVSLVSCRASLLICNKGHHVS